MSLGAGVLAAVTWCPPVKSGKSGHHHAEQRSGSRGPATEVRVMAVGPQQRSRSYGPATELRAIWDRNIGQGHTGLQQRLGSNGPATEIRVM